MLRKTRKLGLMTFVLSAAFYGLPSAWAAENHCPYNPDFIGLNYRIVTKPFADNKQFLQQGTRPKSTRETLTIWRRNNAIAHERGGSDITDVWIKVADNAMALSRFFDSYQRGIEYDVADLPQKSLGLWEAKRQVVPTVYKNQMQKIGEQGSGCDKLEYYAYASPNHQYVLTWSPSKQAVVEYLTNINQVISVWTLTHTITDTQKVAEVFDTRDNWESTDYADIGDNESDPFLHKMIVLGFISHGGSGFYDSQGNPINNGMHRH